MFSIGVVFTGLLLDHHRFVFFSACCLFGSIDEFGKDTTFLGINRFTLKGDFTYAVLDEVGWIRWFFVAWGFSWDVLTISLGSRYNVDDFFDFFDHLSVDWYFPHNQYFHGHFHQPVDIYNPLNRDLNDPFHMSFSRFSDCFYLLGFGGYLYWYAWHFHYPFDYFFHFYDPFDNFFLFDFQLVDYLMQFDHFNRYFNYLLNFYHAVNIDDLHFLLLCCVSLFRFDSNWSWDLCRSINIHNGFDRYIHYLLHLDDLFYLHFNDLIDVHDSFNRHIHNLFHFLLHFDYPIDIHNLDFRLHYFGGGLDGCCWYNFLHLHNSIYHLVEVHNPLNRHLNYLLYLNDAIDIDDAGLGRCLNYLVDVHKLLSRYLNYFLYYLLDYLNFGERWNLNYSFNNNLDRNLH